MVLILGIKMKGEIFKVWKNKKDALQMFIFGLFGVGFNLYFYMLAVQHTNAPAATKLQYLAPVCRYLYCSVKQKIPYY